MRDKVANEQFRTFYEAMKDSDAAHKQYLKKAEWKLGGRVVPKEGPGKDLGATNPRMPVLRVTAIEAMLFAQWLGGALPSLEEWDQAAGRNVKGRQQPFPGDWGKIQQDPKK